MPRIETTKVEFEGRVEEREIIVEEERVTPWGPEAKLRIVGRPAPRVDGAPRVTGQALYTSDIRLPGMLCGCVLRSPHAHARVKRVNSTDAEAMPGVRLVWHREQPPPISHFEERALFAEEVAYQGAEVALVVADDERTAREALAAIQVTYEVLPFVEGLASALAYGAPPALLGFENNVVNPQGDRYERGDLERGWQEAEAIVDLTFLTPSAAHCSLEPHGCAARWEGDELTLWESTQGVFSARSEVAEALGMTQDKVRVVCAYMGGGFGAKQGAGRHSVLAALAARETGRAVRVLLDRAEEHWVSGYRPASKQRIRIGARQDGTLTCIEHEAWQHMGASSYSDNIIGGPARTLYACPNVRTTSWGVRANTDHSRAFRAPGYVEGAFALEGAMDALAGELGIDPLELRLKNYADTDPARGVPYTSKGLREAYETGAERSGWWQRHDSPRQQGPWRRGWGMASQIWGGGGGPPANAIVKLLPDGTVEVLVGVQEIGTGTRTVLAQIAAEEMGLALEAVRIVLGDTLATPYGPTSAGSQTLASAGPAVRAAARDCLNDVLDLAAQMLGVPEAGEEELGVSGRHTEEGEIYYRPDPSRRIPFRQVAAKMDGYTLVGDGARGPNPEGAAVNTFGAQFAEVEVNVETGQVRIRKLIAVHEVGRVINPLTATNQVYGGVLQGLGFAAMEERVIDRGTGLQLTANLEGYKIPTMMDVPALDVSFADGTSDRADPEANSIGAKGLGEPPIIPTAAAIANAVSDALGKRITELPITPQRILAAACPPGTGGNAQQEG
jgi:xanthine dehydrogenase YagR molybdenum-binding subunit